MYFAKKLGGWRVYLMLLASMVGCKEAVKIPFIQKNKSQLEAEIESHLGFYSKAREAKQDIEKILNLEIIEELYPNKDYELSCSGIDAVGDSENLYCFKYSDRDKLTVNYYCQRNNDKFDRYAKEILVRIRGDPYWLISFSNSKGKGVNPDGEMNVLINKIKTEVEGDIKRKKYIIKTNPKVTLI